MSELFFKKLPNFISTPFGAMLTLAGLLIFRFQIDMLVDPDLFARLAVGKIISESATIPRHDLYAFTPTKPLWIDHEWLAGLVFYQIFQKAGELGLFLVKLCVSFLSLLFLFLAQGMVASRNDSTMARVVWLVLLSCFITLVWHTTIRSQVFTYLFLALELLILVIHEQRGRAWPLLLLLMIMPIWANCHGGFVVGLGFLGIHAFCQGHNPRGMLFVMLILVGCVLSTLVNPYGFDYWVYIWEAISMKRELIHEWAPVSPFSREAFPLNLLVLVLLLDFFFHRTRFRLESLLLMLVSLYFGYRHLRFVPIPLMVAAVYFSSSFERVTSRVVSSLRYIHANVIVGLLVFLASVFGWYSLSCMLIGWQSFSLSYRLMPRDAVSWLAEHRSGGNILSSYRHGNYLLWRLYPRFKVATDGRYEEVYSDDTFRQAYLAIDPRREGHRAALQSIDPDLIVFDRRALPDIGANSYGEDFSEVYRDDHFSVLERAVDTNARHLEPTQKIVVGGVL